MVLSSVVQAAQPVGRDIIEFSVKAGHMNFGGERKLDDTPMTGASLGFQMTPQWAFTLDYASMDSDDARNGGREDIDVQRYELDALYFFRPRQTLRPYLVFGFGQMDVDGDRRDENGKSIDDLDNFLTGGIGVHKQLNAQWSVRGDYRALYSLDLESTDNSLAIHLVYRFGGGDKSFK